ncbi:unnamed protein product [Dovyalis caffra]|uniref:DEAD-box helicase OB fold domain-containing protein n=1 Tax=Dovyalis caffra TaxID=77055 RepID=A0AAV1QQJ7_9ROSI|nr:unnamed protein product [Dovyalis caffra]
MKRARDIRDQLEGLLERVEIEPLSNPNDLDAIKKSITSGFFPHSARLQKNGSYRTVKHPQTVHIHPSSGLSQLGRRKCHEGWEEYDSSWLHVGSSDVKRLIMGTSQDRLGAVLRGHLRLYYRYLVNYEDAD